MLSSDNDALARKWLIIENWLLYAYINVHLQRLHEYAFG